MSEVAQLASLFNTDVFMSVNSLVKKVSWTSKMSTLVTSVNSNIPEISDAMVITALSKEVAQSDIDSFLELTDKYRKKLSLEEIASISQSFFDFYLTNQVTEALEKSENDVSFLVKAIRQLPTSIPNSIPVRTMFDLDMDDVIEEELGGVDNVIESTINIVNTSTPFNGYIPGQVIQIVAPPGAGKSALMMQEAMFAAAQGKQVLWIALGDLMYYDLMTRSVACYTQTPYPKVIAGYEKHKTDEYIEMSKNFRVIKVPSKGLTGDAILEYCNTSEQRIDLLVVDYDSNVDNGGGDNMYEEGGRLYDILTAIARPTNGEHNRLVMVGSQPKIGYWSEEVLELDSAGESSRKQHNVDMMLTMGKCVNSKHTCGYFKITKMRRGKVGAVSPYRMTDWGEIQLISQADYTKLKTFKS